MISLWLTFYGLMFGVLCWLEICDIKYINNIVEQDHRRIKRITNPMLGFKSFVSAEATLGGIDLHRMLRKWHAKSASNMPVLEQFYALAGYNYFYNKYA